MFSDGKKYSGLVLIMLLAANIALADRRSYVWTYEYLTMPKGMSEIEYYLTTKVPDLNKYDRKNVWEHQVEWEYGITDHWDFAIYQRGEVTNQSHESEFDYTGSKFRTRYRLGERGMHLLDTLFYFEYIKPDGDGADAVEGKLILSKDIGKFNLSYNQIMEIALGPEHDAAHEYAAGVAYEFSPKWKASLETTGSYTESEYFAGPTVSWAPGKFWVNFGVLRGLNENAADLKTRLIVGIPF